MPLVSAIVPTRDRAAMAVEAVRSVLAQDGVDLEVLVVDDGSATPFALPPDLTGDPRVTILRREHPAGPAAARNAAAARASGDVLAFCDDDDRWLPGYLGAQLDALDRAPAGTGVSETGYDLLDAGGRLVQRYLPDPARDTAATLLRHQYVLLPTVTVVTAEVFHAVGGFDESLRKMQDWDLWLRVCDRVAVTAVEQVLAVRRVSHPPAAPRLEAYLTVTARIRGRLADLPPAEARSILAHHRFMAATLRAEAGQRHAARADLLAARRLDPSHRRTLAHLPRTVVGEAAWRRVADAAAGLRGWRARRGGAGAPTVRW